MADLDKIPMICGAIYYDWEDVPSHFRMVVDQARLAKLVRNADTLRMWCPTLFCEAIPQKTAMLSALKQTQYAYGLRFAVVFNGLDLLIIGAVEDQTVADTDEWLADFDEGNSAPR